MLIVSIFGECLFSLSFSQAHLWSPLFLNILSAFLRSGVSIILDTITSLSKMWRFFIRSRDELGTQSPTSRGGGVLPYKVLMGTCGQWGYIFRDFCLKKGIAFYHFVLNRVSFFEEKNCKADCTVWDLCIVPIFRKARPSFFRVLYKMTLRVNVTNLNCGNTIQTTNKRLKWYV